MTKSKDPLVHRQSIQWLQARAVEITPSSDTWTSEIEPELMACHTGSIIRQSLEMFRHLDDHAFDCLDVLGHFAQFQTIFRSQMVDVDTFEWLVHHLFPHYSSVPRVIEKAMAFLGYLVKDNGLFDPFSKSVQGIPIVLERIEQYLTVEGVVREACYVLAAACHNFRPSQLQIGVNLGMKVIARVFLAFPYHPQVLYWACLTLGNAACGYEPNQIRGQKYKIVDCIVAMKIKFILKLNALGDAIEKETNILETLAATAIGEEVRNEMDLHELRRQSLIAIQSFMKSENVLGVANYALEYMMNDQQKQIQARTKHLATRLVSIRLSAALIHWQNQTNKVFMGRMLHRVLGGMAAKLLYSALRKWEQSMRELRMEQSTLAYRANKGLILDLRKSKKAERYRLLVQSK
ncbi:hypothetical protein Ae201684_007923 [Aphanomyces euteiches]|nr:hypothetical protein Ae201684_007923 [Aphanomyces euteiches]